MKKNTRTKIVIGIGLLGAALVALILLGKSKAQCPSPFKPTPEPCVEGSQITEICLNSPNIPTFKCQNQTWMPINNQCAEPSGDLNYVSVVSVGDVEVKVEYLDQNTYTIRQFRNLTEDFITGVNCMFSRGDINEFQRNSAIEQFQILGF